MYRSDKNNTSTMSRIDTLQMCRCIFASASQPVVWPVDLNTGACRDCEQKHGKREKFRRQPSENVPYKAVDAVRGRRGKGREAAPGEQEITSPDVRSFGFRAPRPRSWEKPALFFRERDLRKKATRARARGKAIKRGRGPARPWLGTRLRKNAAKKEERIRLQWI